MEPWREAAAARSFVLVQCYRGWGGCPPFAGWPVRLLRSGARHGSSVSLWCESCSGESSATVAIAPPGTSLGLHRLPAVVHMATPLQARCGGPPTEILSPCCCLTHRCMSCTPDPNLWQAVHTFILPSVGRTVTFPCLQTDFPTLSTDSNRNICVPTIHSALLPVVENETPGSHPGLGPPLHPAALAIRSWLRALSAVLVVVCC